MYRPANKAFTAASKGHMAKVTAAHVAKAMQGGSGEVSNQQGNNNQHNNNTKQTHTSI